MTTFGQQRIRRVRHTTRCKKCMREVIAKQVNERCNGQVPVMFTCPKHGTLWIQDVVFGQTEDVVLKSPLV